VSSRPTAIGTIDRLLLISLFRAFRGRVDQINCCKEFGPSTDSCQYVTFITIQKIRKHHVQKLKILLGCFLSVLFLSVLPAKAQSGLPSGGCLVSEFRSLALLTHDVAQRIVKVKEWLRTKGASCTPTQLSTIVSNRSSWLGTADTVAISAGIDGLIEAKITNNPDQMASMYSSKGKEARPSVEVTQPPPAPAPVVPPPSPLPASMGVNIAPPVIVQIQQNAPPEKLKEPDAPDATFSRRQRGDIKDYYEENRGSRVCPREMAKRGDNCEARFRERDWKIGQPLPPSERTEELPTPLLIKLGRPAAQHQFKRVGVDILMLKGPQNIVTDAVLDLGGLKAKESSKENADKDE
jgi:hypothetical protein